jgi:hypothetical protein
VGDVSVGGIPDRQGVELVGEDQVALVAEDVVGDRVGDCLFGSFVVVGGGDPSLELLAGGEGKSRKASWSSSCIPVKW